MEGKGSNRRPLKVSRETFERNWDRALKRDSKRLDEDKPRCYMFNKKSFERFSK